MSYSAYDQIYGIPSVAGNGTGIADNGSVKHPGDYAPAHNIDFCELVKEIYSNTQLLHSVGVYFWVHSDERFTLE